MVSAYLLRRPPGGERGAGALEQRGGACGSGGEGPVAQEGRGLWLWKGGAVGQRGRASQYCPPFPPPRPLLSKLICLEGALFSNSQKGTVWAVGRLGEGSPLKAFFELLWQ